MNMKTFGFSVFFLTAFLFISVFFPKKQKTQLKISTVEKQNY